MTGQVARELLVIYRALGYRMDARHGVRSFDPSCSSDMLAAQPWCGASLKVVRAGLAKAKKLGLADSYIVKVRQQRFANGTRSGNHTGYRMAIWSPVSPFNVTRLPS